MSTPQQPDPYATPGAGTTPPLWQPGSQPDGSQQHGGQQYGGQQYGGQQYGGHPAWGAPPAAGGPGWPDAPGSSGWGGRPQQTEVKAVIALALAISSFVLFPLVPAVVALFVAAAARRDIDASYGRLGGAGLVTAAKVVSWINIGLFLAAAVLGLLLFTFLGIATSTSLPA